MNTTSKKRTRSPRNVKKKRPRSQKSLLEQKLAMMNPNAAGIDIASREHWVCVPEDRAEPNVRQFGTFTCDLYAIAAWLKDGDITSVAMESTGVDWIPLFQVLERQGLEVCLVNAKHLKNVSNRPKTDRLDCQWIQRLHSYGLLAASFRPEDEMCQLRSLVRHRDTLIQESTRHIQHMHKALHQMNLILDTVISNITGATGLRIIQAILDGERRPEILAQYRDFRIKATEEDIAKSLEGTYREEHLFVLRQAYSAYQFAQQQIMACDQAVETLLKKVDKAVDANHRPLPASTSSHRKPQGNEPTYNARSYVYEIYGVDLTQVPGCQASTVQTLLSEVGRDMTKWKTEKHFTSWLGLSPNAKRSGGKNQSMNTRKVQSRAALAFRHAARAVSQSHSSIGAFYRRLRSRCGPSKALTATARKLAVIFYHMVKEGKEYQELGEAYYIKQHEKRQLKKLKTQARLLGFDLIPTPTAIQQPEAGGKENTG